MKVKKHLVSYVSVFTGILLALIGLSDGNYGVSDDNGPVYWYIHVNFSDNLRYSLMSSGFILMFLPSVVADSKKWISKRRKAKVSVEVKPNPQNKD